MTERQWMLGQYEGYEVVSALRKTTKLRLTEEAFYWLTVILEHGGKSASRLAAKQLVIVASEDVDDEAIMIRAWTVYETCGAVAETDALYFLLARMCDEDVPRWWESERGREIDRLWSQAMGDVKDPARRREIPPYALDRHTRRGWQVKREQGWFDDRFSGDHLGRAKTSFMYQRDGLIDADSRVECDRDGVADDRFREVWRERKRLQGEDYSPPPDHEPESVSLFDEGEEA